MEPRPQCACACALLVSVAEREAAEILEAFCQIYSDPVKPLKHSGPDGHLRSRVVATSEDPGGVCTQGLWSCPHRSGAAPVRMVSPSMKALVDAVWAVWSIGVSIYDYIHTSAMEERIHTLENVITVHQCVIGLLTAGLVALFTYILLRKH